MNISGIDNRSAAQLKIVANLDSAKLTSLIGKENILLFDCVREKIDYFRKELDKVKSELAKKVRDRKSRKAIEAEVEIGRLRTFIHKLNQTNDSLAKEIASLNHQLEEARKREPSFCDLCLLL